MKVCIATYDVVGPIRNGGIGTASAALAGALAAAGHQVTILYVLGSYSESRSLDAWVEHYRRLGIVLEPLPPPAVTLAGPHEAVISLSAYEWLRARDFDVIHFHEWRGAGFYSLVARRAGLAFPRTRIVVTAHSPYLWHRLNNHEYLDDPEQLRIDHLERESVRLADELVCPSQYLIDWMRSEAWQLPEQVTVRQNILPRAQRSAAGGDAAPAAVRELVFFGRLEARKGLVLFCDALDRLAPPPGTSVTFLGKEGTIGGQPARAYLAGRARAWRFPHHVISELDHAGALAHLAQGGRLAVIASLVDNSPYTVLECLAAGVPLVACAVGGVPELIHPDDRAAALVLPRAAPLAERLEAALRGGARAARPARGFEDTEREWLAAHHDRAPAPARAVAAAAVPLVSVCLVHHDRPELLAQALASLEAQDYPRFEVVLVDDGSGSRRALEYLDGLEASFAGRGWRIVRQPNLYLGAARNRAAREARGEWLLFMDDDNVAKPHEISTFVSAAQELDADFLTCQIDVFAGPGAPAEDKRIHRWLMTGGPIAAGALRNVFGDANGLYRRSAFLALGGFSEDFGLGHEDWEFFARAALSGARLFALPEALFWYRKSATGMLGSTSLPANHQRSLRPYLAAVPPSLRNLVRLAQGQQWSEENRPAEPLLGRRGLGALAAAVAYRVEERPRLARVARECLGALRQLRRAVAQGYRLGMRSLR